MPKEYKNEYQPLLAKAAKDRRRPKVSGLSWIKSFEKQKWVWQHGGTKLSVQDDTETLLFVGLFFCLQLPNKSLLLAVCAAGIGGTFQYGYNISVINAPTAVIILLPLTGLFP